MASICELPVQRIPSLTPTLALSLYSCAYLSSCFAILGRRQKKLSPEKFESSGSKRCLRSRNELAARILIPRFAKRKLIVGLVKRRAAIKWFR